MKKKLTTLVLPELILIAGLLLSSAFGQEDKADTSTSPIALEAGDLKATFADNEAYGEHHRNRYNGISELGHKEAPENLYVPLYAGFNLEHFFGGDYLEELFEPREHPMILSQIDDRSVRLYQPPPPRSKVESTTLFTLVPPHAIDVSVEIVFHDLSQFRHGYAGLFWASYIHEPEDKRIHFWGIDPENPEPHWISSYSDKHGVKGSHLYIADSFMTYFAPDFNTVLASDFSDHRWIESFYFGKSGKMVYALFFDREKGIRFSQSPTGGGDNNPAWDHQFIVPNPEIGKTYGYRARLVYKPFVSAEDVREEYHRWRNEIE
jgi:hypothetical protein